MQVAEFTGKQGLKDVKIVASDGLNEQKVTDFVKKGAQIDVYGIGTNLVTCESQPALGMVYKLVRLLDRPIMKFTSSLSKATFPDKKRVFRLFSKGKAKLDVISMEN